MTTEYRNECPRAFFTRAHRVAARLAAILICVGLPAVSQTAPDRLLCLGQGPNFMMTAQGSVMTLDYLGDGQYEIAPPLSGSETGFWQSEMITKRQVWDLFFEDRACSVARLDLDVTVEIVIPTSQGLRPLRGCCIWQRQN